MDYIKLEILGINIQGIPNVYYHDEGFVNIRRCATEIYTKYTIKNNGDNQILDDIASGKCIQIIKDEQGEAKNIREIYTGKFSEKHIYILYSETHLKKAYTPFTIAIRAHEETHALDFIGRLDLLNQRLFDEQRVKIDLDSQELEVKAGLGEMYALYSRNINPLFSRLALDIILDSDCLNVYRLYHKCKMSKKRYNHYINQKDRAHTV